MDKVHNIMSILSEMLMKEMMLVDKLLKNSKYTCIKISINATIVAN